MVRMMLQVLKKVNENTFKFNLQTRKMLKCTRQIQGIVVQFKVLCKMNNNN